MGKAKADKKQIAKLILDNKLTQEQTSQLTGISRSRISEIMSEVKSNPDQVLFTSNKDKVFEGLQAKLINLADDDLLKTMLSKRGFTDVAILQDKISLIRGQATEIIDYRSLSLSGTLRELREARARAIDQQKVINNEANEQVADITNDIA